MNLIVLVVDHGLFVAVVGVVRYFRIGDGRVFDIDVHAEIIVVDDGDGLAVRQEGQAFSLFDVPALSAKVEDQFFLGRYDLAVQAAVFEIAVIGDGRISLYRKVPKVFYFPDAPARTTLFVPAASEKYNGWQLTVSSSHNLLHSDP